MTQTTISSRDFNQNATAAKRAASEGPVIITERGKPAHVLLTFAAYQKLVGKEKTLAEMLYMPGIADIDFEIPRLGDRARPLDFS